jgi:hypothetical protein
MRKLASKRRGVTVSVDPQTHAQISELAESYSKQWGKFVLLCLTSLSLRSTSVLTASHSQGCWHFAPLSCSCCAGAKLLQ